jgi:hypothetical protein
MAIGWLSALKVVPWSDVISNAPLVADGAKKLWGAVAKKTGLSPAEEATQTSGEPGASPTLDQVNQRVSAINNRLQILQDQMAASSELISKLAEQNGQLIVRLDALKVRLRWFSLLLLLLSGLVTAGLGWLINQA